MLHHQSARPDSIAVDIRVGPSLVFAPPTAEERHGDLVERVTVLLKAGRGADAIAVCSRYLEALTGSSDQWQWRVKALGLLAQSHECIVEGEDFDDQKERAQRAILVWKECLDATPVNEAVERAEILAHLAALKGVHGDLESLYFATEAIKAAKSCTVSHGAEVRVIVHDLQAWFAAWLPTVTDTDDRLLDAAHSLTVQLANIADAVLGVLDPVTLDLYRNLADLSHELQFYALAERGFSQLRERSVGLSDGSLKTDLWLIGTNGLANAAFSQGQFQRAAGFATEAVDLFDRQAGNADLIKLHIEALGTLGASVRKLGRLTEAENSYRRILDISTDLDVTDDRAEAVDACLGMLLELTRERGDCAGELEICRLILTERTTNDPDDRSSILEVRRSIASLLLRLGYTDEAITEAQWVIREAEALGDEASQIDGGAQVAGALHRQGRERDAIARLESTIALANNDPTRHYDRIISLYKNLGDINSLAHRFSEALTCYEQALQYTNHELDEIERDRLTAEILYWQVCVHVQQHEPETAYAVLRRAIGILECREENREHEALFEYRTRLGQIQLMRGEFEDGYQIFESVLGSERNPEEPQEQDINAWQGLARAGLGLLADGHEDLRGSTRDAVLAASHLYTATNAQPDKEWFKIFNDGASLFNSQGADKEHRLLLRRMARACQQSFSTSGDGE